VHQSDVDDMVQRVWIVLLRRLPRLDYDPAAGIMSG
jgi:hypothetical protein